VKRKYTMMGLSLTGLGISLYLALTAYSCSQGCNLLHSSSYARVLGIPIAWFGVIGYSILALLFYKGVSKLYNVFVALGCLIELWLMLVMFLVVKTICYLCLCSALIIFFMGLYLIFERLREEESLLLAVAIMSIVLIFLVLYLKNYEGVRVYDSNGLMVAIDGGRIADDNKPEESVTNIKINKSGYEGDINTKNNESGSERNMNIKNNENSSEGNKSDSDFIKSEDKPKYSTVKVVNKDGNLVDLTLDKPAVLFISDCHACENFLKDIKKKGAEKEFVYIGIILRDYHMEYNKLKNKLLSCGIREEPYMSEMNSFESLSSFPAIYENGVLHTGKEIDDILKKYSNFKG